MYMEETPKLSSKPITLIVAVTMLFFLTIPIVFIINNQSVNANVCLAVQTKCPPFFVCGGHGFVPIFSFDPVLWFVELRRVITQGS